MRDNWNCIKGSIIGAFIGIVLALRFGQEYWYGLFIGLAVGGIISYVMADIKGFLKAIPEAWKRAKGWRLTAAQRKLLKEFFLRLLAFMPAMFTFYFSLFYLLRNDVMSEGFSLVNLLAISSFGGLIGGVFFAVLTPSDEMGIKCLRQAMRWVLIGNPVSVSIWILPVAVYFLASGLVWLKDKLLNIVPVIIEKAPEAVLLIVGMVFLFLWNLYILIHTRSRFLVLVDTMLAIVIGYIVGITTSLNIITCATIGAGLGPIFFLINKELIAVRWLKLKPANCTK